MTAQRGTDDIVLILRSRTTGEVVGPGDGEYESARSVWNGMIDKRPAAIVRCSGNGDVAAGVALARERGLPLAVRGGGHNVAGLATCDGGIVLDLGPMDAVDVDPERRLVTVQGGATWRQVDAATQPFGLATPSGLVSETGVGGFTLGGGLGWLRRKHGLACDNMVGAEVVTASGKTVRTSATENPELLWALRGGGGNFGVVTSFRFALHDVGPDVEYALVLYDARDGADVLRRFRAAGAAMPREVSPVAFTGQIPEGMEGVPPEHAGEAMVAVAGAFIGPPDEAAQALDPLRELAAPLADLSGRMPYVELQRFLDEEYPRGRRYYWKSAAVADLSDAVIDIVVEHAALQPSPISTIDVWLMGGAAAEEPAGGSAYAGRGARYLVNPEADWDDPGADAANVAWARRLIDALAPHTVGTYLNFPGLLEEGERQLRLSFGSQYERLVDVKTRWDPDNVFRLNHNVIPRGLAAA